MTSFFTRVARPGDIDAICALSDEAFGLAFNSKDESRLIRALQADGMTMLIVSHEMAFIREVASIVVFMDQGRVVEVGPPAQILDAPKSDRLRDFCARILRH